MAKSKEKYPSRARYDLSHPTVSARLPLETRKKLLLNLEKGGITLADAFKILAGELELQVTTIEETRNLYMVTCHCNVCGKPIPITSPEAKEVAGKLMTEHGWGHKKCHKQGRV